MTSNLNKITFILILATAMACHDHSDEKTPSKEELLTGNSSKNWNVTFSSDDASETDVSCKAVSEISADNVWTFKTKGKFAFSNGTITEMSGCETCQCSDFADLVGTWTLTSADTLSVIATGVIESNGDTTALDPEEILRNKITSITTTEFVLGDKTKTYIKFGSK